MTDALTRYRRVRARTTSLCEPLEIEDYTLQSMPDASPALWHLAHTTWFFETFVLKPAGVRYDAPDAAFHHLFNSYYNGVGTPYARARRGLIVRPTVREVRAYRTAIDEAVERLLEARPGDAELAALVILGTHHEEQHQELLLTDLLHAWSFSPLAPAYRATPRSTAVARDVRWIEHDEEVVEIGHRSGDFAYDNEGPAHRVLVPAHAIADRLVTNGEYLGFIEAGGYDAPELWLSEGWAIVCAEQWRHPLYWQRDDAGWHRFGLDGRGPLDLAAPVSQLSYFEADAYARWAGARLPTEFEWEAHARQRGGPPAAEHHLDASPLRPSPAGTDDEQWFGHAWEWTSSSYAPYPGFLPAEGAIGEYNGKFMCNQYVLRGGSCCTPADHIRPTYRNFFPTHARWQFSGLRLCRDLQ